MVKAALVAFSLASIGPCTIGEEAAVGDEQLYLVSDFHGRTVKLKNQIYFGFSEKL